MKSLLLVILLVSYIASIYSTKFGDCGIPLTRKIYYSSVVVSPDVIDISQAVTADSRSISINVGGDLQDYVLGGINAGSGNVKNVTTYLQVMKDGVNYLEPVAIGDLCNLLSKNNDVSCPIKPGPFSYSYKYVLPALPSGNYTVIIVQKENATDGNQIGCLSVPIQVIGLGEDSCSYSSTLSAVFAGTAHYYDKDDQTYIQIGPYGPSGYDLSYTWGTFRSITASPDLAGYALDPKNLVWGLRGTLNTSRGYLFQGTAQLGYLPDKNNYENAQLIYQGTFSWVMTKTSNPPYMFQSGTIDFIPGYTFPAGFPYPLNIGNLGTLTISPSNGGSYFNIAATKAWCRCNCDIGGVGKDDSLKSDKNNGSKGMSGWIKGTIAIAVIGTFIIIVAIFAIIKMRRSKPRPVVYDDADLMDPQKPDYGTLAIREAFEDQDQEFD